MNGRSHQSVFLVDMRQQLRYRHLLEMPETGFLFGNLLVHPKLLVYFSFSGTKIKRLLQSCVFLPAYFHLERDFSGLALQTETILYQNALLLFK